MTQKLTFKKYIGKVKCPKCSNNGYLELWASEPPYMPVFRVKHTCYGGRKNNNSISKCFKVCWLLNEQADKLFGTHFDNHPTEQDKDLAVDRCYICSIYMSSGIVPIHQVMKD